jgi:hypothetical protein
MQDLSAGDTKEPLNIFLFAFTLTLLSICIFLIIYNVWLNRNRIDPKSVPTLRGQFSVKPNVDSSEILSTCGPSKNLKCTETGVIYLSTALDYCLSNSCDSFSYSPLTGVVKLLNSTSELKSLIGVDTYFNQGIKA